MDIKKLTNSYNVFYKKHNFNNTPTVWKVNDNYIKSSFIADKFRTDNAYVWQVRMGDNIKSYLDYYDKLRRIDKDFLFNKTLENGSYGCITWNINDTLISRDLLDSIIEIYYMKRHFEDLNTLNLLEIGAGYGRLCKRYTDCFPDSHFYITDGIPYSTYLSDIYLQNYNYQDKNIKLFNLEEKLKTTKIDVAINIHSFPEQNIKDVEWWISLISKYKIKYLFFVPNNPNSNPKCIDTNSGDSILDLLTKYNYTLKDYSNMFEELNINYSYKVPFFIFENCDYF
jgi:putative sugar O-methyltransferase